MRRGRIWRRTALVGATAVALTAGMTTTALAQPLSGFTDGGFEYSSAAAGSFTRYYAPATVGAWTVTQGSVDLSGAGFWQNADGAQSMDLDGAFHSGGVAQTFRTHPYLKYRVRYALAGNPASGPAVKTGQVLVNGKVRQNFSFDITGKTFADMGYERKHTYFVATGRYTTLELRSTTGSGYGPVVDAVRVESCLLVLCHG